MIFLGGACFLSAANKNVQPIMMYKLRINKFLKNGETYFTSSIAATGTGICKGATLVRIPRTGCTSNTFQIVYSRCTST
jgi:hypothetical protein